MISQHFFCRQSNSIWAQGGQRLKCFWYTEASGSLFWKIFLDWGNGYPTSQSLVSRWVFRLSSVALLPLSHACVGFLRTLADAWTVVGRCISASNSTIYIIGETLFSDLPRHMALAKGLLCPGCISCDLTLPWTLTVLWYKCFHIFVFMALVFKQEH